MAQSLFSVGLGLADDNIFYLSGSGSPLGTSGDVTFDAPVGSYYSDSESGATFKKVANNGNAADWSAGASTAGIAALQAEVDALELATGQNADGTFSGYLGTNYLNSATSLKNADTLLDGAVKANADALAAEVLRAQGAEAVLTTNLAAEVTRASAAEAALNTALATEATARADADAVEQAARIAADAALTTAVTDEATARAAADTILTTALANEVARAQAAEAAAVTAAQACCDATNTALAAEVAARQAADTAESTARSAADATLTTALATEVTDRTAADAAEVAARQAADAALTAALATEVTDRTTADTALGVRIDNLTASTTTAITNEVNARTAADTNLQNQINSLLGGGSGTSLASLQAELDATQVSAGLAADGTWTAPTGTNYLGTAQSILDGEIKLDTAIKAVSDSVTAEVTARGAAVTAEAAARIAADTAITATVTQEIADRTAADTAEAAARTAADAALQTEVDAVEASVGLNADGTFAGFAGSNFLGSATTIKAGLMALDSQVKTNTVDVATLTANFAGIDAALQAEIDRTQAAAGVAVDGQMVPFTGTNYLDAVSTIRAGLVVLDASVKSVSTDVTNEITRATAAEAALAANLAAESAARGDADSMFVSVLNQVKTAAGIGYGNDISYAGTNYLDSATTLKGADILLDAAVKSNTDAIAALTGGGGGSIGSLQAALDAEIAARIAADAAELAARTAADTTEQTARIAGDAANATALATEVTARTDADTALTASIAAEATARTAADTALQGNIDAEATARTAADTALTNALASEVTARQGADATETAARIAGDAANATAVTDETTRAQAAEATLATNLATEVARATAAEGALTTNLAAEVTRATAAETALATSVADEVARATAAETALAAVDAGLAVYVGKGAGAKPSYSTTNYVATNDDLTVAIGKLDAAVRAVATGANSVNVATNVTTSAVVDSVSTKGIGLVKWLVYVQAGSNKQAIEVLASHNGDSIVDATAAEFTTYAKLRMGGNIAGLSYAVSLSGTGVNQNMNLVVTSGASATVRTVREVISLA